MAAAVCYGTERCYQSFWNFVNFLKNGGIGPGRMTMRKQYGYLVIGGSMALLGFLDFLGNINFLVIAQLAVLAMVVISGPAIVFLLVARGGDL